jgi:hypothetical protein
VQLDPRSALGSFATGSSRQQARPCPLCPGGDQIRHRSEMTRCAIKRHRYVHWRISSAATSIGGETVIFGASAVLRLMMNSNLLGCSTGRSAGLIPPRILST